MSNVLERIATKTRSGEVCLASDPTDEQLQHSYIFSNYYNLQSVYFESIAVGKIAWGHVVADRRQLYLQSKPARERLSAYETEFPHEDCQAI